MLIKFPDSITR
jgi:hypothetical protein